MTINRDINNSPCYFFMQHWGEQETTPNNQVVSQENNQSSIQHETAPKTKGDNPDQPTTQPQNEVVEMLKETISIMREQLQAKDQQLTKSDIAKV